MGLFEKVFRPKENKTGQKASSHGLKFFGIGKGKHDSVFSSSYGDIYQNLLVRAAIDARARQVSKLKVEMQGTAKIALKNKLSSGPNQWQTWSQFLYRLSTILDLHNTAFVVPVFDEYLRITGYYPVLPDKCEIVEYKNKLYLRYKFSFGETAAVELDECAILTKYQYKSDFFGEKSHALDDTLKLINLQHKGVESAVDNTTNYKFYASLDNFAIGDDLKNERKEFTELNLKKDEDANGLLLFPNTYRDIHQIKAENYSLDAGEIEAIDKNVFEYFGVNEAILTNAADATALDAFFNGFIEPFAIQLSEAMTRAVYTERERQGGKNKVVVHANRLQYMSTNEKIQLATQLGDRGVLTVNEQRELFNYETIEGGDVAAIRGEYKNISELKEEEKEEDTKEEKEENTEVTEEIEEKENTEVTEEIKEKEEKEEKEDTKAIQN